MSRRYFVEWGDAVVGREDRKVLLDGPRFIIKPTTVQGRTRIRIFVDLAVNRKARAGKKEGERG